MDDNKRNETSACPDPHLADLFPLYINGNVHTDDRTRIEEHLAACFHCQEKIRLFLDLQSNARTFSP